MHIEFRRGDAKERDHLEDLGLDERIICNCILKKWYGTTLTGLLRIKTGQVARACECGNEIPGSLKCGSIFAS